MAANIFTLMGSIFVDNEEANKSIAKTSEEGEKSGSILAKLGGTALEVGKKFGEFALGVASAATGAAAALAGIAMQSSEAASRVNDAAQVLGISNEAFQEWDYILGLNGASIDSFGVGMKTLQQKMDDLSTGGKAATELFTNLGIEFDTIANSTPEEAMELVIQKLQEMPEGAEKTALALDAFGKQGMALMPVLNMTAEETEKLKSTAHELGMVMSDDMIKAGDDFGDALDTAKGMISGVKNQIGAELLPAMTAGVEAFVAFATGAEDGADKLDGAIELMVDTVAEKIPAFLEKGGEIVIKLVEGVTTAVPKLVEAVMPIVPDLVKLIISFLPLIIQAGIDIIVSVAEGIAEALPDLIPAVVEVIMSIVTTLIDGLPEILDAALQLMIGLAEGLIKAIPVLIKKLPELITSIINFILGSIPQLIEAGLKLFVALVEALPEIIIEIVNAIPKIIDSVITAVIDSIPLIVDAGVKLFVALIENLPQIISLIIQEIPKIVTGIVNKVTELIPEMVSVGSDLIKGLWQGINDVKDWILGKIGGFFGGIVDSVKSFFGIQSPSKLFRDEIGKMIPAGMALGIEDNADKVKQAVEKMGKMTYKEATLWIKDYRNSTDYLIEAEAAMWDKIAEQSKKGSKERIAAESEVRKLREQIAKEESKNQADQLKEQEKAWKDFYDYGKLLIEDYRNSSEYSKEEEIKMQESLLEQYTEVSKEKIEIDKTINKLREDLRKEELAAENAAREESFNFSKTWIETQKKLGLLTMQQEVEGWERVSARYEEGTKQREEADKNLSKAREDMRKTEQDAITEMEKLESNYTKAVEDRAKAIFDTFNMFAGVNLQETNVDKNTQEIEKQQSIYDKLQESLGSLDAELSKVYGNLEQEMQKITGQMREAGVTQEKYNELQAKSAEIQEKYGEKIAEIKEKQISTNKELEEAQSNLTKATEESAKSQAQIMAENLTDQIDELKKWEENMKELSKKGLDEGLLEELRKMGPAANKYLEELNSSSDEELTKLSELYQEKHELARELAVKELEGLREDTDDKITQILGETAAKASSQAVTVGEDMIMGMIQGIDNKSGSLVSTIERLMYDVINKANSALQIRSPSRVFAKIGSFTGEGFIDGLKSMADKVKDTVANTFSGFDIDDITANLNIHRNMPSLVTAGAYGSAVQSRDAVQSGGVTNHFHISGLTVREEADVKKIAQELRNMKQREMRARGFS